MYQKTNLEKLGAAQSALLAVMLGLLGLAVANLAAEASETYKLIVHRIGKIWIPGAEGIGPYLGKETIALLVWLISWLILHRILRSREWNQQIVIAIFLFGIGVATTLLWPPIYSFIAGR